MTTSNMTTSNMTSCAQPMQITFETANHTPIAVCFNHTVHGTKHFVHYGAVKGSARTRHELDMPCSRPVYESTLRHLARDRHSTYPIVAEIFPMEDGERVTDVADVHEYEILEALTSATQGFDPFLGKYYSLLRITRHKSEHSLFDPNDSGRYVSSTNKWRTS